MPGNGRAICIIVSGRSEATKAGAILVTGRVSRKLLPRAIRSAKGIRNFSDALSHSQ